MLLNDYELLDVKEWFVKDVKELKLNDQIWIDYKANNEVSSVEALKRIKLFEYSNLYLCLFFHYIIQGSLCSQRDHEKVMLKDSGVQNYTFGLGPVGLRTRLVASKYAFACYHVTQRNSKHPSRIFKESLLQLWNKS